MCAYMEIGRRKCASNEKLPWGSAGMKLRSSKHRPFRLASIWDEPLDKDLPLAKAVLAYRNEYLVERGFARLKGRTLSLTPMYLKDDDRVTGLIRLLSIGLRVLTLLEFVVQRGLAESQEKLAGLYAGNPKRTTVTPRAETLLEAFKTIYLNTVTIGEQIHLHITPLSDLQMKILSLLGLSPDIYSRLAADSPKPP